MYWSKAQHVVINEKQNLSILYAKLIEVSVTHTDPPHTHRDNHKERERERERERYLYVTSIAIDSFSTFTNPSTNSYQCDNKQPVHLIKSSDNRLRHTWIFIDVYIALHLTKTQPNCH